MPALHPSLSRKVKSDLSRDEVKDPCCRRSELSAFIHLKGSIIVSDKKPALHIWVDSAPVARYLFALLKGQGGVTPQILYHKGERVRSSYFTVRLAEGSQVDELLYTLRLKKDSRWVIAPFHNLPPALSRCCRRSYLKGAFLSAGSLSSSRSGYHLEIFSEYESYARIICSLMEYFSIKAGLRYRKKGYYVYIKKADSIMEFLRIVKAHPTLLQMENQRVLKSMRNQVNRLVNCETANLDKSLKASHRQLQVIKKIEARIGLNRLPLLLRETAELRRRHPDVSLKELGEMVNPPVSKSGMNHRFRKLERMLKQLEDKGKSRSPAYRDQARYGYLSGKIKAN